MSDVYKVRESQIFFKVEKIPNDEAGDYRAVAEMSTDGGLLHVVVYASDWKEAFDKLEEPVQKIEGEDVKLYWEQVQPDSTMPF